MTKNEVWGNKLKFPHRKACRKTIKGIQQGEKRVIENLLRHRFGELDAELNQIIDRILLLPPE
ncbi:hypothetical protein I8748_24115 [Nostoc sp. CENA67]|uniref:Uncharacterized protein n=1 Tax=Amazonocrinis nigriterrae CENA67 TaxID=2794033 RepID=A0A8J7LBE4_9NOST|nr:hypothetical protein [Amazonocrinis nigriterrae]MBH8565231.1 hypothetical protein [Amazonocrinis nigriterrae CENA67]